MHQVIEFMFSGAPVRVEVQDKAVIVHFFGRPLQFGATKAALRERVRAEITKAGLSQHLSRIISKEGAAATKRR